MLRAHRSRPLFALLAACFAGGVAATARADLVDLKGTKPGDTVLVEDLTYSGMKALAQFYHLKLRGVAMDSEGLRPDLLDARPGWSGG